MKFNFVVRSQYQELVIVQCSAGWGTINMPKTCGCALLGMGGGVQENVLAQLTV
jgi:hypothetical protein